MLTDDKGKLAPDRREVRASRTRKADKENRRREHERVIRLEIRAKLLPSPWMWMVYGPVTLLVIAWLVSTPVGRMSLGAFFFIVGTSFLLGWAIGRASGHVEGRRDGRLDAEKMAQAAIDEEGAGP